MKANRKRVRVYDAEDVARKMRETFVDRPVEKSVKYPIDWPPMMQNIGDSLAVAYASDKWKPRDARGRRELELYKHLAESRNKALAAPGLLVDYHERRQKWPVVGPMVALADDNISMPSHFAMLGLFEEICLQLHTGGTAKAPRFGRGKDDGVVHSKIRHAYLGGSMIQHGDGTMQPFIFVFTKEDGVMFLVTGDELRIEKDGIAG